MKTCPSCKKEIASSANPCPHCGHKFTTGSGIFFAVVVGLILGAIVLSAIMNS